VRIVCRSIHLAEVEKDSILSDEDISTKNQTFQVFGFKSRNDSN